MKRILLASAISALFLTQAKAGGLPGDPLNSGMWESIAQRYFPGEITFDNRVKLLVPAAAEDQFFVPVTVDASALGQVEEIVVVADLNPIQRALSFRPGNAEAYIGLRLKVEQTTPIRAAARTADGVWHMATVMVDAAGGGCSAPAQARSNDNWMATLGRTKANVLRQADGDTRITVRMRHPMDTGLADGIPAFYLHTLSIDTAGGKEVAALKAYEPVSENPTFTLKARLPAGESALSVRGRDTEGNEYGFSLAVPTNVGNAG